MYQLNVSDIELTELIKIMLITLRIKHLPIKHGATLKPLPMVPLKKTTKKTENTKVKL